MNGLGLLIVPGQVSPKVGSSLKNVQINIFKPWCRGGEERDIFGPYRDFNKASLGIVELQPFTGGIY